MTRLLSLLFIMTAMVAVAQPDTGSGAIVVPPAGSGLKIPDAAPAPSSGGSIFDEAPVSHGSIGETELNANFGKPSEFANPNERYIERLNKKTGVETAVALRQNQFMGDVRTKATSVKIIYRDHEYPDNDQIKVWVNGRVVKPKIYLDSDFQGFDLSLEKGFNKIDFEALNQGESGPNTAEFQVYDDGGNLISSNRWNLATGFKATVIVVKEEE